jgi:hypothetical protein
MSFPNLDKLTEHVEQAPHDRLQAAGKAFADLNRTLPNGLPPFQLPEFLEMAAGIDALTTSLIDKGLIDADEFVAAKTVRMAEMIEQLTEQARELKRKVTGFVIAGQNPQI